MPYHIDKRTNDGERSQLRLFTHVNIMNLSAHLHADNNLFIMSLDSCG